jgi:hypothetical protein
MDAQENERLPRPQSGLLFEKTFKNFGVVMGLGT